MGARETRRWPVLVLMCVAQFVNVLDVTVVLVALPSIGRDLNLPPQHLQWVVSAYALLFAGFLLLAGRAADLFGRRRTFMSGLALFAAASLVCGLAGSPEILIFGRAAQGLGAAITAPAALSIITTTFPDGGERDRALGVWTAVAAGGGAAGFVLGGLITDGLGWEWVFLVNVPVAALGLALTPALIPESRDDGAPRRLDLLGAVTITAGLVALVYGLTRVEESGFGSLSVFGTLAFAAALIWTFFLVEGRATNPLVPLRVFRSSNVVGANLVASVLTATTSPIGVILTLYLQRVLDLSPTAAGLTYLPFSLSVVAGSFIGSRLTGSVGAQATMVSGLVFVAAASLILGGISAGGGFARLPVCLMLSGSGLGCASVASTALGTSAAREGEQGLASGLLNTSAQVGTALGLAALTTIATARSEVLMSSGEATAAALVGGFGVAFYTGAGLAVAGAYAALLLVRDKWRGEQPWAVRAPCGPGLLPSRFVRLHGRRDYVRSKSITERSLWVARLAVLGIFFLSGFGFGSWAVRIPAVQERLGLSEGLLGVALLGMAAGSLVSMPLAGWLVSRLGSRPVVGATALAFFLALPLLAVAPSLALLVSALALAGASGGSLDVSMNAQAVAVEKGYGRPIMSSFHAAFSLGGLAGAAVGGAVAASGVGVAPHLASVSALSLAVLAISYRRMLPAGVDRGEGGEPAFARPTRALAGLGVISFCVLLGEGAMADWSAVYLNGTLGTGPGFAAAGFAAFSAAMVAGRLLGDRVTARFGPVALVRAGAAISAAGLGVSLAVAHPAAALVGFGCAGLGFSIIFPAALSAAGRAKGTSTGPAIAAVATAGYFGFLVGPPSIGFVAEAVGLGGALFIVVALSAAIVLLAGSVGRGYKKPKERGWEFSGE